jgi:1,4-alpha-glucan branching enzyme
MITAGTTVEYACNRAISHLENFQQLDTMINVGVIDQKKLLKLEKETQGLFPDINVSYFNPEIHNDDRYKDRLGPATLMLSWEYPPRIMGGLARHVDDLSHALAGMGQPVSVLTTRSGSSPVFEEDGDVRVYRVAPYQEAGREINFHDWVVQLNLVFFNMAQKIIPLNQAMVLHAHDWLVGTAARAIQRAWGIPLIATIHATEYGRNGGLHTPLQRKIHRQEKELVEAADRVICCSNYMAAEVVRLFEIPREKVVVIGNGVFTHKVAAPPLTGEKRRRYVLDDESLIFFVGRLVKEKGVDVLLRALPRVFAEHPRAKAVVSGRGPMFFELQKQAEDYGISERVLFTGFVDDEERNKLLASADIAVFPSFYEPFGIVALEAMAAGTPVIVSDVGGMGDVVEDGVDGLKFTPGDDEKLARAILLLLSDHNFSDLLRQNGKITAATSYSWHALAGITQRLYHQVWQEVQQKRDQLREVN